MKAFKTLIPTLLLLSFTLMSSNAYGAIYADYSQPCKECSCCDLKIFDAADEKEAYSLYGFSRGDIKYLYTYKYNPKTEETVSGQVLEVLRVQYPDDDCYLVDVIRTDEGDMLVHLGPVWYADENNLLVNEGDYIQVTGSRVRTNGRYILIGSHMDKNGQDLKLRKKDGKPEWNTPKSQQGTNGYTSQAATNEEYWPVVLDDE